MRLLSHPNKNIVKATVEGIWHSSNKEIDNNVLENWKNGFVESEMEDYFMTDVLNEYPDLAEPWLQKHAFDLADNGPESVTLRYEDSMRVATDHLNKEARGRIINQIDKTPYAFYIVKPLVGNDTDLYLELLKKSKRKDLHLLPLYGALNEKWVSKVKAALDFGYSHEEVARAIRWDLYKGWMGDRSKVWAEWIEKMEPFSNHDDEAIQKVIGIAINEAKHEMERALVEERNEKIFGRE